MKRLLRKVAAVALVTLFSAGFVGVSAAEHQPADLCGHVITQNTTLHDHVGPCASGGIVIGADNITLDLNGYHLEGLPIDADALGLEVLDAVGVLVDGRTGVTITDSSGTSSGRIRGFDAGVALVNGTTGTTVSDLTVTENVGKAGSLYGDGIYIGDSDNNTVSGNLVTHNGPFSGIGVYSSSKTVSSTGNTISANSVEHNDVAPSYLATNSNTGIRIEENSTSTLVTGNVVRGSAKDGIALFAGATGSTVSNNVVEANGGVFDGSDAEDGSGQLLAGNVYHRRGDGIRVFEGADSSTVSGNTVCGNAANGIKVEAKSMTLTTNTVGTGTPQCAMNHAATIPVDDLSLAYYPVYELNDTTAKGTNNITTNCGNNNWTGNVTHAPGTPNDAYNNACTIKA